MRIPCLLAIAHLVLAAPLTAQVVQGEVVSAADKRHLPGLRVVLYDSTDNVVGDTRSDSVTADFFFEVKHAGQYRLALFDRLGNPYLTPAFAVDSGATVERQLLLPQLPPVFDSLPVAVAHVAFRPGPPQFPSYPPREREAGHGGAVRVAFVIDAEGNVERKSVHVISATNEAFADAVVSSVERARFIPAADAPRPLRVIDVRSFTFNLSPSTSPAAIPCVDVCVTAMGIVR